MQHSGAFSPYPITRLCIVGLMMLLTTALTSCATADAGGSSQRLGSKVQACRSGDQLVSSASQCLQDGAACYELSNGNFCTGERGNSCPTGSSKIPAGAACPPGTRCIAYGEGLNCAIQ